MKQSLIAVALILCWSTIAQAQDSDYSEEELQLIKGMLWRQEEIEKEQAREAEQAPEPEAPEVDMITEGDSTFKKQGEGWVLEFDDQVPAAETVVPAGTDSAGSAGAAHASGVELIVGGQGKDGIAKSRDLPIVE